MHEENSQATSRWNKHLSWLSSHINKLWSPFQSNPPEHHHPLLPQNIDARKNNSENQKKMRKMDPKLMLLQRMRLGNLNQVFEQKIKRVNKYFTKKEENNEKPCDLLCPVCLQFLVKPVTTTCGHNFCIKCLDQTLLFKPECPSCRHYLRGTKLVRCQTLHKLILRSIQKYSEQQIELYNAGLQQSVQWLQNRTLKGPQLEVNQKIDAKDTEFIWCRATIKQVYKKQDVVQSLLIHYEGWNPIYDQIIEMDSDRLARLDIPHYKNLNNEEERMYSYVVSHQNEQLNQLILDDNNLWNPSPLNLIFGQDLLANYGDGAIFQLPSIEQSSMEYQQPPQQQSSDSQNQSERLSECSWSTHRLEPELSRQQEQNESNTSEISNELAQNQQKQGMLSNEQEKQKDENDEDLIDMSGQFEISTFNADNFHHFYIPRSEFSHAPYSDMASDGSKTSREEGEKQQHKQEEESQEQPQCEYDKWERQEYSFRARQLELSFDSIINNSSLWAYGKENSSKDSEMAKKETVVCNPEKQEQSLI